MGIQVDIYGDPSGHPWGSQWTSIVQVLNKKTSKSPKIMDLLRPIVLCTLTNNFTFTAKNVPLLPATEITLLYFVGHLSQSVSYATVKTYLASVSYLHVIFQVPIDMGTMQLLEKCMKGLKCLKGETPILD